MARAVHLRTSTQRSTYTVRLYVVFVQVSACDLCLATAYGLPVWRAPHRVPEGLLGRVQCALSSTEFARCIDDGRQLLVLHFDQRACSSTTTYFRCRLFVRRGIEAQEQYQIA